MLKQVLHDKGRCSYTVSILWTTGAILLFSFTGAHGQSRQESVEDSFGGFFGDVKFQITGFTDYTTSARIYPASRDEDPIIKTTYNDFGGFVSFGGDARVILSRANAIGICIQSLSPNQRVADIYGYNSSGQYIGVPVEDGFNIWLLELNGYFDIPVAGDNWDIYLGGGPAVYLGKRNLQIGTDEANTPTVTSLGIQVSAGVAYKFASQWGIRGEMKFRSPEFNTTSTFSSDYTYYQGVKVSLPQTLYGKIDVDGTNFTLGVFYQF